MIIVSSTRLHSGVVERGVGITAPFFVYDSPIYVGYVKYISNGSHTLYRHGHFIESIFDSDGTLYRQYFLSAVHFIDSTFLYPYLYNKKFVKTIIIWVHNMII